MESIHFIFTKLFLRLFYIFGVELIAIKGGQEEVVKGPNISKLSCNENSRVRQVGHLSVKRDRLGAVLPLDFVFLHPCNRR